MEIIKPLMLQAVEDLNKFFEENEDLLSHYDLEIGDGDHGINMHRGWKEVNKKVQDFEAVHFSDYFSLIGRTLMSKVGGASGPLLGMGFLKGVNVLKTYQTFDWPAFLAFVIVFSKTVQALGKAKKGDKTMVDVLVPYTEWLESPAFDYDEEEKVLDGFVESTKEMHAKKGRASFLGERSIGHIDPGSVSIAHIMHVFSNLAHMIDLR